MCNQACIEFSGKYLTENEIQGKRVIEVGSYNANGSVRPIIENLKPQSYLGIDIFEGPNVDEVCNIYDIIDRYGRESFDVVITTELIEHVRYWRTAISNLKNILKPNGTLIVTTRSKGFSYHGCPYDFWRYEIEDMNIIFSDLSIEVIEPDPISPGVFVKAHKPEIFSEKNMDDYKLYSIIRKKYCGNINEFNIFMFKLIFQIRRKLSRLISKVVKLKK